MNKKILALVGVVALGMGGVSAIALQSRAQSVPVQPTATVAPATVTVPTQESTATATDSDNIQNDLNGVEKPDATSIVKQGSVQDQGETDTANPNEVEDGN